MPTLNARDELMTTMEVENFIGFLKGISGNESMDKCFSHAEMAYTAC